jgi:hypothetical protein
VYWHYDDRFARAVEGEKMLFTVRTMRNTNTLYVHHYVDILVLNTNHCP